MSKVFRLLRWISSTISLISATLVFILSMFILFRPIIAKDYFNSIINWIQIPSFMNTLALLMVFLISIPTYMAGFLIIARKNYGLFISALTGLELIVLIIINISNATISITGQIISFLQLSSSIGAIVLLFNQKVDFDERTYTNIAEDSEMLVVYGGDFKAKKRAYELANQLNAVIFELNDDSMRESPNLRQYSQLFLVGSPKFYYTYMDYMARIRRGKHRDIRLYAEIVSYNKISCMKVQKTLESNIKGIVEFKHTIKVEGINVIKP